MGSALRAATLATTTVLALLLTGCGGDGSSPDGSSPDGSSPDGSSTGSSTGASDSADASDQGLSVTEGTTPEELLTCLEEAGLPAAMNDSVPWGVEVPSEGIEVEPLALTALGSEQGADLWVFGDAAAAEEHRVHITLSDQDDDKSWVAGNVVVRLFYPAEEGNPEIEAIRSCLPA